MANKPLKGIKFPGLEDTYITAGFRTETFSLNNVVCIGDSFLHGWYKTEDKGFVPYGWGEALRDSVKRYNPTAKFAFCYDGGSGFHKPGDKSNRTFKDHITHIKDILVDAIDEGKTIIKFGNQEDGQKDIDVIAPAEVETVIILGGVNDIMNRNTIDYQETVTVAKQCFPNAKIVLAMSPLYSKRLYNSIEYKEENPNDRFSVLTVPSNDPRICVLTDSYYWIIMDEFFYGGDGLHPNVAGHKKIASHLLHASYGMSIDAAYMGTINYPYEDYVDGSETAIPAQNSKVSITYRKLNDTIQMTVSGTVSKKDIIPGFDSVLLGTRPYWMSRKGDEESAGGALRRALYTDGEGDSKKTINLLFDYGGIYIEGLNEFFGGNEELELFQASVFVDLDLL